MAWEIRRVRVGGRALKVVKPGRLRIMRQWIGRDVWVNFPVRGVWYLVEHDELVRAVGETAPYLESMSWKARGAYSTGGPSRRVTERLARWRYVELEV